MKAKFEKLETAPGQSFRCFDRRVNRLPARWHRHPELELTYVPAGNGSRLVGDHLSAYGDHDMVLVGSNLPHTWSADAYRGEQVDMHEALVLQFRPDFLGEHFFEIAEMRPIRDMIHRSERGLWFPPQVAISIERRFRELTEASGPDRLIRLLDILYVLSICPFAKPLATDGYVGPTSSVSESRVQFVCDYTQRHFTDPEFTVGNLAKKLRMNASAFSRFFKQSTGQAPSTYLNQLRIGFACRRLIDSDRSVLEVCYDSGFSSTSNFNETFRRLRGVSPREYRQTYSSLESSQHKSDLSPASKSLSNSSIY